MGASVYLTAVGAAVGGTGVGAAATEELELAGGGAVGALVGGTGVAVGTGVGAGAQEATTAPAAATADNRRNSRRVNSRFIFLSSFGIVGHIYKFVPFGYVRL